MSPLWVHHASCPRRQARGRRQARAHLNHSHAPRSQRHAARCQTSVLAPLREMSLHNAFPHASRCIQPKCTGGSSSLSPLSAAFFKVSDRKATADAAQEGTESLGAEARIYADRHPKLIDRGCITPVSAETRRLDASSRHRRRRLDTPGSACDEGAVWTHRAVRATRAPSGHTGQCVRRTQDPG
ncbi:hypothetical protein AHiyo1_28320 [Arthrobacter sp. Hiyo1]|nr:hypothetical protein AHiyo1_28320 [Arthrobacter sp. Hiyo1]